MSYYDDAQELNQQFAEQLAANRQTQTTNQNSNIWGNVVSSVGNSVFYNVMENTTQSFAMSAFANETNMPKAAKLFPKLLNGNKGILNNYIATSKFSNIASVDDYWHVMTKGGKGSPAFSNIIGLNPYTFKHQHVFKSALGKYLGLKDNASVKLKNMLISKSLDSANKGGAKSASTYYLRYNSKAKIFGAVEFMKADVDFLSGGTYLRRGTYTFSNEKVSFGKSLAEKLWKKDTSGMVSKISDLNSKIDLGYKKGLWSAANTKLKGFFSKKIFPNAGNAFTKGIRGFAKGTFALYDKVLSPFFNGVGKGIGKIGLFGAEKIVKYAPKVAAGAINVGRFTLGVANRLGGGALLNALDVPAITQMIATKSYKGAFLASMNTLSNIFASIQSASMIELAYTLGKAGTDYFASVGKEVRENKQSEAKYNIATTGNIMGYRTTDNNIAAAIRQTAINHINEIHAGGNEAKLRRQNPYEFYRLVGG